MICDIHNPDGTPFAGCPRQTLKRVIAKAKRMGFEMMAGPEAEFFLFQTRDGEPMTETHDAGGYFDLTPVDQGEDVRRQIVLNLEDMGSKSRPRTTRSRRASTKSTSATTR